MEKNITLTVNAWCRVKLTKHGLKIIQERCPHSLNSSLRYNKKTKMYSTELWHLMNIFGECMWMGNTENPFVNNEIKILQRD